MTEPISFRLRQLASPRRPETPVRGGRRITGLLLRLGCVALLAWIGYIHLHLWQEGYGQIPTNGPLCLILAAVLLVWPRPLAALLAAGYTVSTLGALIISLTVGLFGFHESISASFVIPSLTVETITALALLTWAILVTARPRTHMPRQSSSRLLKI